MAVITETGRVLLRTGVATIAIRTSAATTSTSIPATATTSTIRTATTSTTPIATTTSTAGTETTTSTAGTETTTSALTTIAPTRVIVRAQCRLRIAAMGKNRQPAPRRALLAGTAQVGRPGRRAMGDGRAAAVAAGHNAVPLQLAAEVAVANVSRPASES